MKTGPHTASTIKALASGNTAQRKAHVITPAMQAGISAERKLTTTSKNRTGLFFVAYQTYAQSSPTNVTLKLTATPSTPHLMPMTKPAMHTGAEISA